MSRIWDHLEWTTAAAAAILALLAIPAAAAVGGAFQERLAQEAAAQEAHGPRTVAVLLEDGPSATATIADAFQVPAWTAATWRLPDQTTRTGAVLAEPGSKAGLHVPIWLDAYGSPTHPPASSADVTISAVVTALFVLAAIELALLLTYTLVRLLLDRARLARWQSEWRKVEPSWRSQLD